MNTVMIQIYKNMVKLIREQLRYQSKNQRPRNQKHLQKNTMNNTLIKNLKKVQDKKSLLTGCRKTKRSLERIVKVQMVKDQPREEVPKMKSMRKRL